jgi:hypothetical protein
MIDDYVAYPSFKGQELKWLLMDTEELFDKNMSNDKIRKELNDLNWTKDSITYKFNDQGFRSEEFDSSGNSIVFLGCSYTVGIGVQWEDTFSKIVSDDLKLKCFNLGIGAGSMDSCFRFAIYWLEKLKPKIVVLLEPNKDRKEIKISKHTYRNESPGHHLYKNFYKDWILEEQNMNLLREKNFLAIKYLSNKINTKFISMTIGAGAGPDGKARDLTHSGPDWHSIKARYILKEIGK